MYYNNYDPRNLYPSNSIQFQPNPYNSPYPITPNAYYIPVQRYENVIQPIQPMQSVQSNPNQFNGMNNALQPNQNLFGEVPEYQNSMQQIHSMPQSQNGFNPQTIQGQSMSTNQQTGMFEGQQMFQNQQFPQQMQQFPYQQQPFPFQPNPQMGPFVEPMMQGPYKPYPTNPKGVSGNNTQQNQFASIINQFKNNNGTYDVSKMMNTAGQFMNTMNQVGGLFKQVGFFFK
jgi:hypothetical protein